MQPPGRRGGPPSRRRRRIGTRAALRRGGRLGGPRPDPAVCGGARSSSAGATPSGEPQARRGRRASRGRHRPQRQATRFPSGGGLRAASARAGRSSRREHGPFALPATGGVFALGGGHFCRRFLGATALGRTQGRVALPMLRRRSGGGPVPPGGGLRAASAGRRSGERERAPLPIPRRAGCFSLGGDHFCSRFLGASALGRTRAGSRYQCAVAGATAVRRSPRPARRRARRLPRLRPLAKASDADPARRQARGPLRPGRAEAARKSAPHCPPRDGRAALRSAGVISAGACLAPAP